MGTLFILVFSALMGSVAAYYAQLRGRDPVSWFGLGMLFGVFAIIALYYLPAVEQTAPREEAKPFKPLQDTQPDEWWYLDNERQIQGPFKKEALQEKFEDNSLTEETLVWKENLTDWLPARSIFFK